MRKLSKTKEEKLNKLKNADKLNKKLLSESRLPENYKYASLLGMCMAVKEATDKVVTYDPSLALDEIEELCEPLKKIGDAVDFIYESVCNRGVVMHPQVAMYAREAEVTTLIQGLRQSKTHKELEENDITPEAVGIPARLNGYIQRIDLFYYYCDIVSKKGIFEQDLIDKMIYVKDEINKVSAFFNEVFVGDEEYIKQRVAKYYHKKVEPIIPKDGDVS